MQDRRLSARILNGMDGAIEWIVAAIIGLMVVNISMGIFFRFVLNNALFWTEEMSRYLMVWAGMLGSALALKDNNHVGITMVIDLFKPAVKRVLQLLARLVIAAFLAIVFVKSFAYLDTLSIQTSAAMQIPMVLPYFSVTAGSFLMFIENLALAVRLFARTEKPGDGE